MTLGSFISGVWSWVKTAVSGSNSNYNTIQPKNDINNNKNNKGELSKCTTPALDTKLNTPVDESLNSSKSEGILNGQVTQSKHLVKNNTKIRDTNEKSQEEKRNSSTPEDKHQNIENNKDKVGLTNVPEIRNSISDALSRPNESNVYSVEKSNITEATVDIISGSHIINTPVDESLNCSISEELLSGQVTQSKQLVKNNTKIRDTNKKSQEEERNSSTPEYKHQNIENNKDKVGLTNVPDIRNSISDALNRHNESNVCSVEKFKINEAAGDITISSHINAQGGRVLFETENEIFNTNLEQTRITGVVDYPKPPNTHYSAYKNNRYALKKQNRPNYNNRFKTNNYILYPDFVKPSVFHEISLDTSQHNGNILTKKNEIYELCGLKRNSKTMDNGTEFNRKTHKRTNFYSRHNNSVDDFQIKPKYIDNYYSRNNSSNNFKKHWSENFDPLKMNKRSLFELIIN